MSQTHTLFQPLGYQLEPISDNLYTAKAAPQQGQLHHKRGVFYIKLEGDTLQYFVVSPKGLPVNAAITLEELNAQLADEYKLDQWPSADNLNNYIPLLSTIWSVTAERKHTWGKPIYKASRDVEYPSDHLLISGAVGNYNVLSWNTMGKDSTGFSAFQYDESERLYDEQGQPSVLFSDALAVTRHHRIVETLAKAAEKQQAHIIHLQETNVDAEELQARLGEHWKVIDSVDHYAYADPTDKQDFEKTDAIRNRMITCYRTDVFEHNNDAVISRTKSKDGDRCFKVELQPRDGSKAIDSYNIWSLFNDFPDEHETIYRDYIADSKAKGHDVLIAGDSNTRFMPADNAVKNITTGLIPPTFLHLRENAAYMKDNSLQCPDYPDIMLHYSSESDSIIQPHFDVLNTDGDVHHEPAPALEEMPAPEKEMRLEYRAVFSVDTLRGNKDEPFLALENQLNRWIHEDIKVRSTVNSLNQRGMIIRFSSRESELYQHLKPQFSGADGIAVASYSSEVGSTSKNTEPFPTISASSEKVAQLQTAVKTYLEDIKQQLREQLQTSITAKLNKRNSALKSFSLFCWKNNETESGPLPSLREAKLYYFKQLQENIDSIRPDEDVAAYERVFSEWKNKTLRSTDSKGNGTGISVAQLMSEHRSCIFRFGKTTSQEVVEQLESTISSMVPRSSR